MAVTSYLTIAGEQTAEIEVLKSRFRCTVAPVSDEAEVRALLDRQRTQLWDARHHCHAFIIGADGLLAHSSDDGEPSGTAGAPILDQLRGRELSDVLAVVTRWFGGTLLGTGRLARAYAEATRVTLDQTDLMRRELHVRCAVDLDLATVARIEHLVRSQQWGAVEVDYHPAGGPAGVAQLRLSCPPAVLSQVQSLLAEHTGGSAVVQQVGQDWVDRPARMSEPTSTSRSNKNS